MYLKYMKCNYSLPKIQEKRIEFIPPHLQER